MKSASPSPRVSWDFRLTRRNERDARANEDDSRPPRRAYVFTQNELGAKSTRDVAKRRGRNHQADGLPREQKEQRIERQRHQGDAGPKPAVAHGSSQKLQHRSRPKPRRLPDGLHPMRDG